MKLGILFSGGKDSIYAAWLIKKQGHELSCAIVMKSENEYSYMFHTPSIDKTKKQAEVMNIPLLVHKTRGEKENELEDLKNAIKIAVDKYKIDGIITGALHSEYQASRVKKICKTLGIESINPIWHHEEISYLNKLIENNFEIIITAVAAYPLNKTWLGRKIDKSFIKDVSKLNEKYKIHPAGEGGEFETFVLNCPLFSKGLKIKSFEDSSDGENSWRREIELE